MGASLVSISPFMNTARLWADSLIWSCSFEILSFANSSSRTATDPLFSLADMFAGEGAAVAAGIVKREEEGLLNVGGD